MTVTRSIAASLAGVAALGLADLVEERLLGRRPVYAPASIAARWLGRRGARPDDARAARVGQVIRIGYALLWGACLDALDDAVPRRSFVSRVARAFGAIYGFEVFALPLTRAAPVPSRWPRADRLLLVPHVLVFAVVRGSARR